MVMGGGIAAGMTRGTGFSSARLLVRIILTLLLVAVVLPKILALFLESLIPAPPAPDGPYIREVYAPVRVSTPREEVEVWWHMVRKQLRSYYRKE